jgi:predicted acylesterase/phospholipase RssA
MTEARKFKRCMVFAGGGFRFGAYLGMYAAACDLGKTPDVLLASCGGAIAAAIIQGLPDDNARKSWLCSAAMYQFWCDVQATPKAAIAHVLWQSALRRLDSGDAAIVPDLFQDYMFIAPEHLPLPTFAEHHSTHLRSCPLAGIASLNEKTGCCPDVVIIGAKLLFKPRDVGQPRAGRKLFAECVFAPPNIQALLHTQEAALAQSPWQQSSVARELCLIGDASLHQAVRISTADMFYLPPQHFAGEIYNGGVVNLFPIELAQALAEQVVMEFKAPLDRGFALPAWRSVLGINGNARLRQVHAQFADVWIDTSDIRVALRAQHVQKTLHWRHNRIQLRPPATHAMYVEQMLAQWQYGYVRAQEAFARCAPDDQSGMRLVNRHNRPEKNNGKKGWGA